MRHLRLLRHRLRSLLRRDAVEDELERELSLHLEQLTREQMAGGLSEADARRAARARVRIAGPRRGTVPRHAARRSARGSRQGHSLRAATARALAGLCPDGDPVAGARHRREHGDLQPDRHGAAAVAAGGAPAGAGVHRGRRHRGAERRASRIRASCASATRRSAFAGMAAFAADELRVDVDGTVEQVFGQVASGNYFDLLGVRPAAGRLMTMADERLDPAVAVIGYGYAQRRFGGAAERDRPHDLVRGSPVHDRRRHAA